MLKTIQFKKLGYDDLLLFRGVLVLFAEVFGEEHNHIPDKSYLEKILKNTNFNVFILEDGTKIIGALTVYILDYYTRIERIAYIVDLAIHQEKQRQGYGTKLMRETLAYFKKQGFDEVFVQADKVDAYALDFYKKLGGVEEEVSSFSFVLK